jgi:metal-sulfur cluster biosynthetic enzyme
MDSMPIQNDNPLVYKDKFLSSAIRVDPYLDLDTADEDTYEYVTSEEIFNHVRNLNDPEHPLTLEQLNVVCMENITVKDPGNTVLVQFTPTIPHCSMATLIGLCLRVKLLRVLPARFKVTIEIFPGSHQSEQAVNKQLNDKERVAAALENKHLLDVVNKCITPPADH